MTGETRGDSTLVARPGSYLHGESFGGRSSHPRGVAHGTGHVFAYATPEWKGRRGAEVASGARLPCATDDTRTNDAFR